MKISSSLLLRSALAVAMASPLLASAESQLVTGAATTTGAAARLNFSVQIPKVLYLAVGTDNTTINTLTFDYSANAADVGSGTDSAAQDVSVRVLGNNGQITVAAAGSGTGLTNGADVIPWTEILATSSDATNFNVPAVGANTTPVINSGKLTDRTATWAYRYSNTNVAAPGTYTGQVTYTATMP